MILVLRLVINSEFNVMILEPVNEISNKGACIETNENLPIKYS